MYLVRELRLRVAHVPRFLGEYVAWLCEHATRLTARVVQYHRPMPCTLPNVSSLYQSLVLRTVGAKYDNAVVDCLHKSRFNYSYEIA